MDIDWGFASCSRSPAWETILAHSNLVHGRMPMMASLMAPVAIKRSNTRIKDRSSYPAARKENPFDWACGQFLQAVYPRDSVGWLRPTRGCGECDQPASR